MELTQSSWQTVRDFVSEIDHIFVEEYGRGIKGDLSFENFSREVKAKCLLDGVTNDIYIRMRCNAKDDRPRRNNVHLTWSELVEAVQDAEWLSTLLFRKQHYIGSRTSRRNEEKFQVDDDGHVIVYTDGACLRNGQPDAQAGIGVWFDYDHKRNVSKPLNRKEPVTNNVAEIKAVIEAFTIVKRYGVERLAIHTDSNYLINSATKWVFSWLSCLDWQKSNGEPVKHKKQYRELLMAMEGMDVKWVHVKSHSHHEGNIEADRLAQKGAKQY